MAWVIGFVVVYLVLMLLVYLFILGCSKQNKATTPPEESDMLLQCPDCHVYYLGAALTSGEFMRCDCKNKPKLVHVCTSTREGLKMKIIQKSGVQQDV